MLFHLLKMKPQLASVTILSMDPLSPGTTKTFVPEPIYSYILLAHHRTPSMLHVKEGEKIFRFLEFQT